MYIIKQVDMIVLVKVWLILVMGMLLCKLYSWTHQQSYDAHYYHTFSEFVYRTLSFCSWVYEDTQPHLQYDSLSIFGRRVEQPPPDSFNLTPFWSELSSCMRRFWTIAQIVL